MTKKKIARTRRASKKRAENPAIRRAAARAGIKPAKPPDDDGLTIEDRAIIDKLDDIGLRSVTARELVGRLRANGATNDQVRSVLWSEARLLEDVATRLKPQVEARNAMLTDALKVISVAQEIFYVDGVDTANPDGLVGEALRAAEQELDMFSAMKESGGSDLHWQELWRAGYRVKLARVLADFMRAHPIAFKPAEKKDEEPSAEERAS